MGIILLTELGTTPWQLDSYLLSPSPAALLPRLDMVMDQPLLDMVMAQLAILPEAPRDLVATIILARDLLNPAISTVTAPLLPDMPTVASASLPEVPRESARDLLNPAISTVTAPLLPDMPTVASTSLPEVPR